MFREVPQGVRFPELEQRIIAFWRERAIFAKTLEKDAPQGAYVFYEGPPTANGRPGVHHVISRAFKDLFPRFKTMQGYRVGRKGGWDTHGLPVEMTADKDLGLKSKLDVVGFGEQKFHISEGLTDGRRVIVIVHAYAVISCRGSDPIERRSEPRVALFPRHLPTGRVDADEQG